MKTITLKSGKEIELNQAFNIDCLEFMPLLPDKSIDMILCDLPYGTTACKWDVIIPFEPLWKEYKRILKDDGAIVLTASQPFTSLLIMSNLQWFKYEWIWDKVNPSGFQIAKYLPMKQHENICVFGKGTIKYNPQKIGRNKIKKSKHYGGSSDSNPLKNIDNKIREYDDLNPKSIIVESNADRTNRIHPTQKPVKLFQYLINTYTDKGDLVLDNCAGSFTTPIASYNTGRNWLACEMDKQIFKDGSLRYEQETKQMLMEF